MRAAVSFFGVIAVFVLTVGHFGSGDVQADVSGPAPVAHARTFADVVELNAKLREDNLDMLGDLHFADEVVGQTRAELAECYAAR